MSVSSSERVEPWSNITMSHRNVRRVIRVAGKVLEKSMGKEFGKPGTGTVQMAVFNMVGLAVSAPDTPFTELTSAATEYRWNSDDEELPDIQQTPFNQALLADAIPTVAVAVTQELRHRGLRS
jgi:hypothetical protein